MVRDVKDYASTHHVKDTFVLVYVVDSVKIASTAVETRERIVKTLQKHCQPLSSCVVAIVANKQDAKGAQSIAKITEVLQVDKTLKGVKQFTVMPTSVINNQGISELRDWVMSTMETMP